MTDSDININFDKRSGVEALVARLGGLRPCAAKLGIAVGTVQGWKKRGSIPPAHQQKIRALLSNSPLSSTPASTSFSTPMEEASTSSAQEQAQENIMAQKGEGKEQEQKKKKDAPKEASSAKEEVAMEEGIVSAFTSGEDFASGDEENLDISSEVWEHAALPRSTSGQWAMLLSLIALVGVLTRPLWAGPIDTKLMGTFADGGHGAASSESHTNEDKDKDDTSHAVSNKTDEGSTGSSAASSSANLSALPRDLLVRLEGLERDMAGVSAQQAAPAAAELRRLKSESDALAAAFDNQSARLDSLAELLQRRAEALSRLRSKVERLEQNRATERLSRRLNALFQLENIAYAIAQRSSFSLEPLESSLNLQEREQLEDALALLLQANNLSSPQRLLADYRRLLPDLLVWQAADRAEKGAEERGLKARFAQKLRAQLFGIFSLRRRYGTRDGGGDGEGDESALFTIERMLEDGRFQQAEERLQTFPSLSASNEQTREQLGEDVSARLQAFRAALSSRNGVFAALHEIRTLLSSSETGDTIPRRPSS